MKTNKTNNNTNKNTERRTIELNYDQLVDIVTAHLLALGVLRDYEDIIEIEFPGLEVDDDGVVALECRVVLDYRFRERN